MSGMYSRSKGQRGEREIMALLNKQLDILYSKHGIFEDSRFFLQRNTLQSDKGGSDVAGLEQFAIEIKYQEIMRIDTWWEQCLRQVKKNQEPILIYRANNRPWRVRMQIRLPISQTKRIRTVAEIDISSFLLYFYHKMEIVLLSGK